jgi:hypothetical protein
LDFTFDLLAGEAIARRGDNALLWLPPISELVIDGPRGACRRAGDDHHTGPHEAVVEIITHHLVKNIEGARVTIANV